MEKMIVAPAVARCRDKKRSETNIDVRAKGAFQSDESHAGPALLPERQVTRSSAR